MSVVVSGLTKIYGEQKAVDAVSFEVKPGEVLGFLGPNGAGKSTTMKIIAGYIPQTSGKASVCGFDVRKQSLDARARIGYLPENNPLYTDMYVKEFLHFVAKLNGMKKGRRERVKEMIHVTGLENEQRKRIGQLSRGYRQRVGLAQAMIHNPEVLIMDEPTSGLDPNQLVEIRQLIKDLGKEKTVIMSTHIMQEVQAICSRVIILNKGKIVADDTVEGINKRNKQQTIVSVEFKQTVDASKLKSIAGAERIESIAENKFRITGEEKLQEKIFAFAVGNNLTIVSLTEEKQSLEEIFRELTTETEN